MMFLSVTLTMQPRNDHSPTAGDGFGEHDPGCVHCLEQTLQVDTASYLPYQHWSNSLGTQLLMDAQKIDLHHLLVSEKVQK